jgi:hypothetical protein
MLHLPLGWIIAWVALRRVPERARFLLPVVVVSGVLTAGYGWFLWLGAGRIDYQIISTFGLHNAYAGYLLLVWPAAVLAALECRRSWLRIAYLAAALYLMATLMLTYSRASWAVFGLQLLALACWLIWRWLMTRQAEKLLLWTGAAVAGMLCLLLALAPVREALGRLTHFSGHSMQGRLRFWQAALEIFRDHPLGVGMGNFAFVYPQYQKDWMYYSVDPHSWPLQLLCELGIPGLVIALALIIGAVLWAAKLWRTTGGAAAAVLLTVAVVGSMLHAAFDFDYTFGATTVLLGVLLAYGTHLAVQRTVPETPSNWQRVAAGAVVLLLVATAVIGEAFTAERYVLDRIDLLAHSGGLGGTNLSDEQVQARISLLEQAVGHNRFNYKTQYQLASLLATPGTYQDKERAREALERCLVLNPRYPLAWVLKGLLARPKGEGEQLVKQALDLDPYNNPEHYFYYATLAKDAATRQERLLWGLEMIPVGEPITPSHIRPTWYKLNPMYAEWYFELARLTDNPDMQAEYRKLGATFRGYWERELQQRSGVD